MSDIANKATFLKTDFVAEIGKIFVDTKPVWGKMNLQQMTEHMAVDAFMVANGKTPMEQITDEELIPRMQAFIASEKPFKENTPNSLMPQEPREVTHPDMKSALIALQTEIDYFFEVFTNEPDRVIQNPFFGKLNYDLQVQLLYKHACHHLRQFGTVI